MNFVAAVSHELRTPLVIRGAGRNLLRGVVKERGQIEEYSKLIIQHADQLKEMVEQTLALAGADKGRAASRRERVDVATLVKPSSPWPTTLKPRTAKFTWNFPHRLRPSAVRPPRCAAFSRTSSPTPPSTAATVNDRGQRRGRDRERPADGGDSRDGPRSRHPGLGAGRGRDFQAVPPWRRRAHAPDSRQRPGPERRAGNCRGPRRKSPSTARVVAARRSP